MTDYTFEIIELIKKSLQNNITDEEKAALDSFLANHPEAAKFLAELYADNKLIPALTEMFMYDTNSVRNKVGALHPQVFSNDDRKKLTTIPVRQVHFLKSTWLLYAAAIILVIGAAGFLWQQNEKINSVSPVAYVVPQDIVPGGNKAILTLGNGKTILLETTVNGTIAQEGNTRVEKTAENQIVYNKDEAAQAQEVLYHTMTTPRGGRYQLVLPDGSKVWLNAASSIIYPTSFTEKIRQVTITGEAYFEVAKNPSKPFIVKTGNVDIAVIGTEFNVNAYSDEPTTTTTLLQGKISVNSGNKVQEVKPGQQVQVKEAGDIKLLSNVDLSQAIAWKENNFYFSGADLKTIMRQLSRWYDVEVVYEKTTDNHFTGIISRNVKASQVLKMLEQTGLVRFTIERNKVLVK